MADNFGLKIGVEGEKEFKRALADINQSFKVLGSEMKLVESEFGKNENSIQSLTAKNEVLNKQIDAQKEKIETLQKALKNASDSFGENDRRTQNWAVKLNNAKAELNGMERELEQSATQADKLGDELKDAGDAAENSGGKFGKLGGVLKGVGAAMGTVAIAAGAAAFKLGKEVVQQFGELEQNLGGSEAVFGKYASSIQKTGEEAYKNLGVSQSEYLATANKMGALFQGSGVEQQKSLELTEKAMQRAADMASVMGIDMQTALDSVAGAAKGNFTMMDNLGVAMNATNIEAYALAKGLDFTWASATNAEKAEVAMQMFFENTEQYAGNFARESTQTISGSLGLLQAALGSFTAGLGNADADMTNLTQNLVDAFQAVVKNIVPVIENIVSALPMAMDAILTAIGDLLPTLLGTVTELFNQVLETLLNLLPELIPAAVDAVMTIVEALIDNLPLLIDAAVQLITALVEGIGTALPELIPSAVGAVITIVQGLIDNLDKILEAAFTIIQGLAEGLLNALPQLMDALPQIIMTIINFITDNLPAIISMGIELTVQLAVGLIKAIPQLVAKLPEIIAAIVIGLGKAVGSVFEIGKNIVSGLWDGIKSMGNWIGEKISGFFSGIVDGAKNLLGIHSPSTVFAGIGENMGTGIGVGFNQVMDKVSKDMQTSIPTDFNIDTELNMKGTATGLDNTLKTIVEHTGVIEVRGINSKNELTGVVEIIMDQFRREARI
ncbi:phage tail protein [Dehalococcoides sp.]|uniref:phage tail protein n=1 Tax=Dehalococcoides sp. TaxID=1966486 RepID=UPI002ACB1625|nr:phage tail protein [Dehalococcoides sp.]